MLKFNHNCQIGQRFLEEKMKNFALSLLGVLLLFGVTTADVAAHEIEELQAEIAKLLAQIKSLTAHPNEVIVEHLTDVPEFEHVAVNWDGEYPEGNFVYYRPVIWESFGKNNAYGRYDHRLEILHLFDEVETLAIILDDQIISVRDGGVVQQKSLDPLMDIMNSPAYFPEAHNRATDILVSDRDLWGHVKYQGFSKVLGDFVRIMPHGFYPKTRHDLVIRVGETLVGIIFPEEQKMERHRQVRLMMSSDDGVSLHGYPTWTVFGLYREDFEDFSFADAARMSTEALGYLAISEVMRDLTLIVHETEEIAMRIPGAPSARPGPVQSLIQKIKGLFSGAVAPEGKKVTTWGALKR